LNQELERIRQRHPDFSFKVQLAGDNHLILCLDCAHFRHHVPFSEDLSLDLNIVEGHVTSKDHKYQIQKHAQQIQLFHTKLENLSGQFPPTKLKTRPICGQLVPQVTCSSCPEWQSGLSNKRYSVKNLVSMALDDTRYHVKTKSHQHQIQSCLEKELNVRIHSKTRGFYLQNIILRRRKSMKSRSHKA